MKPVIPNCTAVRLKFRERLLMIRGANGHEFGIELSEKEPAEAGRLPMPNRVDHHKSLYIDPIVTTHVRTGL